MIAALWIYDNLWISYSLDIKISSITFQFASHFRKHLVELKVVRDALSKHTERPFLKVREDLNLLKAQLVEIANRSSRNNCQIKKLKANMAEVSCATLTCQRSIWALSVDEMPLPMMRASGTVRLIFKRFNARLAALIADVCLSSLKREYPGPLMRTWW